MSALDQAFVKAYRQGRQRGVAPAAHLGSRPAQAALVVAEIVEVRLRAMDAFPWTTFTPRR